MCVALLRAVAPKSGCLSVGVHAVGDTQLLTNMLCRRCLHAAEGFSCSGSVLSGLRQALDNSVRTRPLV